MKRCLRAHWPLVLALCTLGGLCVVILAVIGSRRVGPFIYTLDDPYIHLAMAKNIAAYGVYGVTRYAFSSSSSSPAWTLLLAVAMRAFGAHTWLPLALNLACAAGSVVVAYGILAQHMQGRRAGLAFALVALVALTPLVPLVFSGMEHSLQVMLTLPFAYLAAREAGEEPPRRRWALYALAPALVLVRFEGLFLIAPAAGLLLWRRRWAAAALLLALGAAPVGLYAAFSLAHGGMALPNSVLLKGTLPTGALALPGGALIILQQAAAKWVLSPHLLFTFALAAMLWLRRPLLLPRADASLNLLAIFVVAALLHLTFARTGWFYRYEAYLVALAVLSITLAVKVRSGTPAGASVTARRPPGLGLLAACLIALVAACPRAMISVLQTPQAVSNIFEQQVQTARFAARYYGGRAVAANDIGALAYLADVRLLDLVGLGSDEVAAAALGGDYSTERIRALARDGGVAIAAVYESWFKDKTALPAEWIKAGEWTIHDNVVCAGDTVAFYAVDPSAYPELLQNLRAFDELLPATVVRRGGYLAEETSHVR